MLAFKKGTYTKAQLNALYDALSSAQLSLCKFGACANCNACSNDRPCKDLSNTLAYISTLISERWTIRR